VRNEERCLDRCLSSLRGAVDELVVVDTGSTDRTVENAGAHGARVGFFAWCDDFAAARNAALDLATGEWVLSIDADEWLANDASRAFVRRAVDGAPDNVAFCPYVRLPDGSGYYGNARLFPRVGSRWEFRVHEQIRPARPDTYGIHDAEFLFRHDGYEAALVGEGAKEARNLPLLRREFEESEPGSRAWKHALIYLARATKRPYGPEDEAFLERALFTAIESDVMSAQFITSRLYQHLILAGRFEEAERINERAMAEGAKGPLNFFVQAVQLFGAGQPEAARRAFARAKAAPDYIDAMAGFRPMFANLERALAEPAS
jgi:glycosyltransferase involved in cell wall biosynthesis